MLQEREWLSDYPDACGNRRGTRVSLRGGTPGQAVSLRPCILRKSSKPVTGTLSFRGYCHEASTHCYVSGRAGETNAGCRGFDRL